MTIKDKLTKPLYQYSFDGDSYHTYIRFEDIDKIIEEQLKVVEECCKKESKMAHIEKELQSYKDKAQQLTSIFGEKSLKAVDHIIETLENLLAWDSNEFTAVELGYWYNVAAELTNKPEELPFPPQYKFLEDRFTYDSKDRAFKSKRKKLGAGTGDDSSLFLSVDSGGTLIWWKSNRGHEDIIFDGKELKTEEELNQLFELLELKTLLKWE